MNVACMGKAEFLRVRDVMVQFCDVQNYNEFLSVMGSVRGLVPFEFGAIGMFESPSCSELAVKCSTYHRELDGMYRTNGFKFDPAITRLWGTPSSLTFSVDQPYTQPKVIEDVKKDFGVRTCLSMGVRGEGNHHTYFACSNFAVKDQARLRLVTEMVGPHMHLAMIRCAQSDASNGHESVVELSAVEAELIKWMSEGKTNWEISMVLKMSERTVRYHVSNLFQKLGVGSRTAAVAHYVSSKPGVTRHSILVHADREIHP